MLVLLIVTWLPFTSEVRKGEPRSLLRLHHHLAVTMDSDLPPVLDKPTNESPLMREVIEQFRSSFGSDPKFVVQVPGRVNLIGEHIDYCGYSVLPMALKQHIFIAVKPSNDGILRIVNVSAAYKSYEGNMNNLNSLKFNQDVAWYNYVICGIRGISDKTQGKFQLSGMSMAVAGNILPNAGLSSSSALVCAAALSTAHANKIKMSKHELATLCAQCEKYIGTAGGGMDQTIAFLANTGCAKFISFKPLSASDVKLPSEAALVVAHSLAEINKAASCHFNCRVAECRLAALLLAHESGIHDWHQFCILSDVQTQLKMDLPSMSEHVKKILKKDLYHKNEICSLLEISRQDLEKKFLPENTWHIESFKLKQRASHVYEEASRVLEFKNKCEVDGSIRDLGKLMNASHESLRDLYECSHEQLDNLVSIARDAGALGARLTGAGWGGCMVALTTQDNVPTFLQALEERYYSNHDLGQYGGAPVVFSSKPGCGAALFSY